MFIIYETYTNGFKPDILYIISFLAILCAILVIISKNPIVSILFLIGLFANISCYLLIIGLTFLGLSYLIVYIGAVSILFLFILMLINIRISELQSNTSNSIPLAISVALFFHYPVYPSLPYTLNYSGAELNNNLMYSARARMSFDIAENNKILLKDESSSEYPLLVTSKIWDGYLIENTHITSIGNIMYTNYNMWLIITSFILLLAMTGAIVITIKKNPKEISSIGRATVLHTEG